ncbi:MAG TPA: MFS transporter [Anaerolineales bacterium]|nr:MFS transporter [Anaerolineales bacterium]
MSTQAVAKSSAPEGGQSLSRIIFASAAGTMIEWYDFYIFGSLATVIASKFYHTGTPLGDLIAWLATFAIGFVVRPFGAIVFGRIGDLIGRKYTFLITMTLMGLCTFAVGLLPTVDTLGAAAGIILITLRILQGLALGGEYGGAATYVAEHSPHEKRGLMTSWIQTTATLGLFVSLGVILITRRSVGEEAFGAWGWRVPFLISILLVAISLWIRFSLRESPMYAKLKQKGGTSKNPILESFGNPFNLRYVALALFGATMGQGVVWYTGQFYALIFLQSVLKLPLDTAYKIVALGLLLGTPFFVVFGALSDKIGRKKIIMAGCLLAAVTYIPIYHAMSAAAEPLNFGALVGLIFLQVLYVTMVYGPIAAFLVETFPARIRYTSLSLPYHFGNGWFGGFTPVIATSIVAATGNRYAGLWFPIGVSLLTVAVGGALLRETHQNRIWHELEVESDVEAAEA